MRDRDRRIGCPDRSLAALVGGRALVLAACSIEQLDRRAAAVRAAAGRRPARRRGRRGLLRRPTDAGTVAVSIKDFAFEPADDHGQGR